MALTLVNHKIPDYSQGGEGRLLIHLLGKLPNLDHTCIEFGAGDGMTLSNTRHLIECYGYSGTMIESDEVRFSYLKKNALPGTRIVNAAVGWTEATCLDALEVPADADVCSIDIDGDDYHVWLAMEKTRPKIVIIEHNPTMSNDVLFVQERGSRHGSSARSLVELGNQKGYELTAATMFNLVFVRRELFAALGIKDNALPTIRTHTPLVTHVFAGYDGRVFMSGSGRIPWHRWARITEAQLQIMPEALRSYSRSKWQERAYGLWAKWKGWNA